MPLIRPSSELIDGLEPHGHMGVPAVSTEHWYRTCRGEEVYPGWCRLGGAWEGYTGYPASTQPRARLRLIYRIMSI